MGKQETMTHTGQNAENVRKSYLPLIFIFFLKIFSSIFEYFLFSHVRLQSHIIKVHLFFLRIALHAVVNTLLDLAAAGNAATFMMCDSALYRVMRK